MGSGFLRVLWLTRSNAALSGRSTTIAPALENIHLIGNLLLYTASLLLAGWGVAHLFPTKNVVQGFGGISRDNQRVITMEWINEVERLIMLQRIPLALLLFIIYWSTRSRRKPSRKS